MSRKQKVGFIIVVVATLAIIGAVIIKNESRGDQASVSAVDIKTLATTTGSVTTTTDLCPNLDGVQVTVPLDYQVIAGKCYKIVKPDTAVLTKPRPKLPGDVVADACINIPGVQVSVPTGLQIQNGQCVVDPGACMQKTDQPSISFVNSSTKFDTNPTGIIMDPNYYQRRVLFDIKFKVTAGNCGVYLNDGADYSSGGGSVGYIQQNGDPASGNGTPFPALVTTHLYGAPTITSNRITQENRGNSLQGMTAGWFSSSEIFGLFKGDGSGSVTNPVADYINGIATYVAPHQTKEFIMHFGHDYALAKSSGSAQSFEARGILNRVRWSFTWGGVGVGAVWTPRETISPQNYMTDWVQVVF